jgi:DNA mismatch endonuclease (patch repair protein)
MADNLTAEQRRKNMKAIRSISKLEEKISKELWSKGVRFRRNVKDLHGKPDIAIKKYKVVIFIDSCFWHGCELHGNYPKTNIDYWLQKLQRNKARDREVSNYYESSGWNILRIWEHEVKEDFNKVVEKIANFINSIKAK